MRCNNHKCVKTPLWRGYLTWSWLDLVTWTFMYVVKSCSWLILVQVPSLYLWLWEFFKVSTGNTKTFPEKILLGAEQVVIRMWHEHTVSKNYQAVGLGEIITKRTFTATGSVNSTAKRDKSDKTLVLNPDDHTLVQQEQKDWDPQSMMMILDSLDAIRWAWILIQISNQESIDTYIERFIQLTRKNPQRLANVKEAWDTFSWTIAMQMRNNKTFKQATEEILQDPVTIADILSQPPRKKPKSGKGKDKKGKGKGKTKNRYNTWQTNPRYQPYPSHATFQPCSLSTTSTIGQSTLPLWPTPSPTDLCQPTSQRTSQRRQEQGWTQVQDLLQVPEIGTAQRLGDSIPASWPTESPNHAAKPFTKTTYFTPCIFPWHRCLPAGLAVPQRQHHQDILLGDWPLLQRAPRSPIPPTNWTHGWCYSDRFPHILPTTFGQLRQLPCHPHHFSSPMQRPFTSTRCTTRGHRQRWFIDPTDDQHRPHHSTTLTNIHHSILDGECLTPSRHKRAIPWHFHPMGYRPHRCRCSRWTGYLPTPTLVARRRLEVRWSPAHRIDAFHTTLDTTRRTPQTTQPHRHDDPCERLGDSCGPMQQTTLSLPHHTGSHWPRTTTSSPRTRRRSDLGKMATRQSTIPTLAIPTTVFDSPTRRQLATNHPITARTTHGSTRQLHQDYRPTPIHSNEEHHVGQCLAFPISTLATYTTTDDSGQPSTPSSTHTDQLTETHWIVAVLPYTLGTTSQNNTSPTHATTRLAQSP